MTPQGKSCKGRWAAYCLYYILAGIAALLWYLAPSRVLSLVTMVMAALGFAYAVGLREGLIWSSALAVFLAGEALHNGYGDAIAIAGLGWGAGASMFSSPRRLVALTPLLLASYTMFAYKWISMFIIVFIAVILALESGRWHVASIAVSAPFIALAPEEWLGLALALIILVATSIAGPIGARGCPFRKENYLVSAGVAVFAGALILAEFVDTLHANPRVQALGALGLILVIGGLLAPRHSMLAPLGEHKPEASAGSG
jgi:hypothetical protein